MEAVPITEAGGGGSGLRQRRREEREGDPRLISEGALAGSDLASEGKLRVREFPPGADQVRGSGTVGGQEAQLAGKVPVGVFGARLRGQEAGTERPQR